MLSTKYNGMVVILMLLTFVGQVMATSLNTCQKDEDNGYVHRSSTMYADSEHSPTYPVETSTNPAASNHCNCCVLECFCPLESCVSLTLTTMKNNEDMLIPSQKIKQPRLLAISPTYPTIFRPPIPEIDKTDPPKI